MFRERGSCTGIREVGVLRVVLKPNHAPREPADHPGPLPETGLSWDLLSPSGAASGGGVLSSPGRGAVPLCFGSVSAADRCGDAAVELFT